MYHCTKCGVTVKTQAAVCPLCRGALHGDGEGAEQTYPKAAEKRNRRLLVECVISLALMLIQVLVNYLTTPHVYWCIPACITVLYSWLLVVLVRTGRMRRGITWYSHLLPVALLVLLFSVYIMRSGAVPGWYLTYGIAFCISLSLLINNGWILIHRRSAFDILPSQVILCLLGFVPVCLALFKVIVFSWANAGTAMLSLATVAGILFLYRSRSKTALRRYFFMMHPSGGQSQES